MERDEKFQRCTAEEARAIIAHLRSLDLTRTSVDDLKDALVPLFRGSPERLDDSLVCELVANLKREHEAWVTVFNHRVSIARRQSRQPRRSR